MIVYLPKKIFPKSWISFTITDHTLGLCCNFLSRSCKLAIAYDHFFCTIHWKIHFCKDKTVNSTPPCSLLWWDAKKYGLIIKITLFTRAAMLKTIHRFSQSPTSAITFKTRHYTKQAPKHGLWFWYWDKGQAALRIFANQPTHPLWLMTYHGLIPI